MDKFVVYAIVVTVCVSALMAAGPVLVALADAAVPLILTLGSVAVVFRLVWYFTRRY